MTPKHLVLSALSLALLAGCASTPSPEQQAKYAEESRATVGELVKKLGGTLKNDIAAHGPETAISVCQEKAPQIAKAIMEEKNVKIRRVTTQNRNPKSVPDAWEAKVLADFEQRLAKGEKPDNLEYYQVVKEGDQQAFRYMKGLVIQPLCLTCHGTPENIPEGVKAKLTSLYPGDKATGYSVGMLRGAVSLKKAL
jgi:hypothetical protein